MKRAAIWAIMVYRKYISINMLHSCRFYPSCSEYAIEAINRYGVALGITRALLRVLRCNPFSPGGCDPCLPAGRRK